MNTSMSKKIAWIAASSIFVLPAGCGKSDLSGTYVDQAGNMSLIFQSGGKVRYRASETGFTEQDTYTISGKKITVKGLAPFNIRADGCLVSPTMIVCKPKKSS